MRKLLRTLKETFVMSSPLAAVIIIVCGFIAPMNDMQQYIRLAVSYLAVVMGQTLFLVGLDISILPIGQIMGESLVKLKRIVFIIAFGLLFGLLATVAEPALNVLARQTNMIIPEVHVTLFIWIMGAGIGIFVGFALFRVVRDISIKWVFASLYGVLFAMVAFVPEEFVALAFDGSGATTGDISVPFILALGLGVSATLSKRKAGDDVFGIIGIASAGPILTVFLYGMILRAIHGGIPPAAVYDPGAVDCYFWEILIDNIGDVSLAIFPLMIVFVPFQFWLIKMSGSDFRRVLLGIIPVFAGLLIFLTGIDYGFAFAGAYIGEAFLDPSRPEIFRWWLLVVGFILGMAITLTEPAVTVLGEQLAEITDGRIKRMVIRLTLAIGIGFASVLAIIKILTQINILWFLVPLYAIAILMMRYTPRLFVGLAFDSGGVSGGALTSAMLTPLALGIAQAVAITAGPEAQSVLTNGFGIIAFISVMPMIAVQTLGIVAGHKYKRMEMDGVRKE